MHLYVFDTLEAVLRTGSLAGAAEEVSITPSAVSMQMKQLEAHFGQPLFDRSGRGVQATALAREIVEVMRPTLGRLSALRHRPALAVAGPVSLGVIETLQMGLLPSTFRYLRARHPALSVRPVRGRSVELVDAVKAGRLDAAVVVQPPSGGSQRLNWVPLIRNELVLVAPPDASGGGLAALFRSHDWIRMNPETYTGRLAARHVARHVRGARAAVDLQSVHLIVAMVNAGLGVSVVVRPDQRLTEAYPVRILSLGRDAPAVQIALVSRKSDAQDVKLAAVQQAIRAALKSPLRSRAAASSPSFDEAAQTQR
jgi:DNA-binding transcriptional LysR family regulator